MKKKLIFGVAAASAASLFWACGDGRIIEADGDSGFVNATFLYVDTATLARFVDDAVKAYCNDQVDPDCVAKTSPGMVNASTESSSSSNIKRIEDGGKVEHPTNNNNTVASSSSKINITSGGTSAPSSSPSWATSSSSVAINTNTSASTTTDAAAWAACVAGVKDNAVQKGGSVTWSASPQSGTLSVMQMQKLSYSWVIEGANPASGTGKSLMVSYATPGKYNTTLVVSLENQSQTVQCPTITVIGSPVTGCSCKASAKQVDIANSTNPVIGTSIATWTVSGCQSTNTNFTYLWSDNLDATGLQPSVGAAMPMKTVYAPSVQVENAEFGVMNVSCDSVKFLDGPEYVIEKINNDGQIALPAGLTSVTVNVSAFNATVFCQSATGTLSGSSVNGSAFAASNYSAIRLTTPINVGTALEFNLTTPATCGVY